MNNCWIYNGKCLESPPEGFYGFIYRITDDTGKMYIGKKAFEHSKKIKISKKVKKETGTRKRVQRNKVDSGWMDYFGSSKFFIAYLDEDPTRKLMCRREIIKLCKDKTSLAYWEMKFLVDSNVLFKDNYWNGNISGKYFKGKIHL